MSEDMAGRLEALTSDVSLLRSDVAALKGDASSLKSDAHEIKTMNRRIALTLTRLEGKVDDFVERTATKDDIGEVFKRMDGFGGRLEDLRLAWAKQEDRLTQLERRP